MADSDDEPGAPSYGRIWPKLVPVGPRRVTVAGGIGLKLLG